MCYGDLPLVIFDVIIITVLVFLIFFYFFFFLVWWRQAARGTVVPNRRSILHPLW